MSQLRAQAAQDFSCVEEQIATQSLDRSTPTFVSVGGPARAFASGCGQQDAYVWDVNEKRWSALRNRAAFELSCEKAKIAVTKIDSVTFGVAGCGQKTVYKLVPYEGFVLDADARPDASTPPPTGQPTPAAPN